MFKGGMRVLIRIKLIEGTAELCFSVEHVSVFSTIKAEYLTVVKIDESNNYYQFLNKNNELIYSVFGNNHFISEGSKMENGIEKKYSTITIYFDEEE